MAISGHSFRNTLVGSGWATSVLLCMNGLRKQSSHISRCSFLAGKPFPHLDKLLPAKSW